MGRPTNFRRRLREIEEDEARKCSNFREEVGPVVERKAVVIFVGIMGWDCIKKPNFQLFKGRNGPNTCQNLREKESGKWTHFVISLLNGKWVLIKSELVDNFGQQVDNGPRPLEKRSFVIDENKDDSGRFCAFWIALWTEAEGIK